MEIQDYILGLLLIYFLIVTMLIIGVISQYTLKKKEPQNETIKKEIEKLNNLFISIIVGILTGAIVVIYYNWTNCLLYECHPSSTLNFFNGWFSSALIVVIIAIILLISIPLRKWILLHKKS